MSDFVAFEAPFFMWTMAASSDIRVQAEMAP